MDLYLSLFIILFFNLLYFYIIKVIIYFQKRQNKIKDRIHVKEQLELPSRPGVKKCARWKLENS